MGELVVGAQPTGNQVAHKEQLPNDLKQKIKITLESLVTTHIKTQHSQIKSDHSQVREKQKFSHKADPKFDT